MRNALIASVLAVLAVIVLLAAAEPADAQQTKMCCSLNACYVAPVYAVCAPGYF